MSDSIEIDESVVKEAVHSEEYSSRNDSKIFFARAIAASQNSKRELRKAVTVAKMQGSFFNALENYNPSDEIRMAENHVKEAYENDGPEMGQRVLDGYIKRNILTGPKEKYIALTS